MFGLQVQLCHGVPKIGTVKNHGTNVYGTTKTVLVTTNGRLITWNPLRSFFSHFSIAGWTFTSSYILNPITTCYHFPYHLQACLVPSWGFLLHSYLCVHCQYLEFTFAIILSHFLILSEIRHAKARSSMIWFAIAYSATNTGYDCRVSFNATQLELPSFHLQSSCHPRVGSRRRLTPFLIVVMKNASLLSMACLTCIMWLTMSASKCDAYLHHQFVTINFVQ